jgi:hypothetical protein
MSEHYDVLLDEASLTLGDLDLTALISPVNHWDRYPTTTDEDLYLRLKNATLPQTTLYCGQMCPMLSSRRILVGQR